MKIIKIILAIAMLVCLFKMPYGYYQFVRFIALVGFAILAYKANEVNFKTEVIIYIVLAVLFQPLIKITLGREIWNIIDLTVAIGLVFSIFIKRKQKVELK